jgi:hypothetical protein
MSSDKRIFYVNSRQRIAGSDSDFTYELDLKGLDITHACVLQAYIPKSFYNVQESQNTFTLEEDGKQATVSIQAGTYTKNSLKSTLQSGLTDASPNGWIYTISTPTSSEAETGKYTFVVSGNSGLQPSFIFGEYMWEQMGFNENSTAQFDTDTLTSPNVINLQPESTIYIKSDLIQDKDNVLQEVFGGNSMSYSGISFIQFSIEAYSKRILSKESNSFRFYLQNEDGEPINLNGLNLVFSLMVWKPLDARNAVLSILDRL